MTKFNFELLPDEVEFVELTQDKVDFYWEKLKPYPHIFSDSTFNPESFSKWMCSKRSYILETKGGIMVLDNIVEGLRGEVHAEFWDHKLSAKRDIFEKCLIWAFITFDLYRLEARIPEFCRALKRIMEKRLGFTFEGRLRDSYWYKGNLTDVNILSILRREVLDNG